MKIDEFFNLLDDPVRQGRTAVSTPTESLTYGELTQLVNAETERLASHGARVAASLMDNGTAWIIRDLACLKAGAAHVPLPLFFTPEQWCDALNASGADCLIGPMSLHPLARSQGFELIDTFSEPLAFFRRSTGSTLPPGTAKITFTSGSTGHPKGVCIGGREMLCVAVGLDEATRPIGIQSHMTALPLPILLENIAGVYAPLIAGAAIHVRPLRETGLEGSSRFDPSRFHRAMTDAGAHSVIVLPQMLRAYATWLRTTGTLSPTELRLMAVGGAAVGANLLLLAREQGLPAYEGYGLSEACSVQTLNLPGADCPGSVGRPLPHAELRVAADGEIETAGPHALGYLEHPFAQRKWLPTDDLGYLDEQGFLHVRGRKSNVLVTSFGRNVSPEWVELQLMSMAPIAQAIVLGEGEPVLGAVIWPAGDIGDEAIETCVSLVNERLPDYARIGRWVRARADFTSANGVATANGRPLRHAILHLHADLFSRVSLYPHLETSCHSFKP